MVMGKRYTKDTPLMISPELQENYTLVYQKVWDIILCTTIELLLLASKSSRLKLHPLSLELWNQIR